MHLVDYHGALDLLAFHLVNGAGAPPLDAAMAALSSRTFGAAAVVAVALALAIRLGRRAWPALLALAFALALSDFVGSHLLKPAFARMRPCYALPPGTFRWLGRAANVGSLPSLHAANACAVAWVTSRSWRALGAVAWVVAALVALSRVYLGVHWPSDILAGALWGTAAAAVAWMAVRAVTHHRHGTPTDRAGSSEPTPDGGS